jgi:hypothetical protein
VNGPVQVFTAIALLSLPTVMFGGFSLLRLLIARRLNEFQVMYFRAGTPTTGCCSWPGSERSLAACSFTTWASASQGNGRPETR